MKFKETEIRLTIDNGLQVNNATVIYRTKRVALISIDTKTKHVFVGATAMMPGLEISLYQTDKLACNVQFALPEFDGWNVFATTVYGSTTIRLVLVKTPE